MWRRSSRPLGEVRSTRRIRIDTYRSSGAGGQHRERDGSACGLTIFRPASSLLPERSAASTRTRRRPADPRAKLAIASPPQSPPGRAGTLSGPLSDVRLGSQIRSMSCPYQLVRICEPVTRQATSRAVLTEILDDIMIAFLRFRREMRVPEHARLVYRPAASLSGSLPLGVGVLMWGRRGPISDSRTSRSLTRDNCPKLSLEILKAILFFVGASSQETISSSCYAELVDRTRSWGGKIAARNPGEVRYLRRNIGCVSRFSPAAEQEPCRRTCLSLGHRPAAPA